MAIYYSDNYLDNPPSGSQPIRLPRIGPHTYTRGLTASSVTASSEEGDRPADAPLRPDTFERWRPSSSEATWEVDLGASKRVDYVAIAAHTTGSSGASITIEHSPDATTWATVISVTPSDDAAIICQFVEVSDRYWRLVLSDGRPEIGVVYIGQILEMQRPYYGGQTPTTLARTTTIRTSRSRSGQFLGQDFRRRGFSPSASFSNLEADWVRDNFVPFMDDARIYPYFFAWRPSTFPKEVVYAWTGDDITPQNSGTRDLMSVSWDMVGFDE